MFKCLFCKQSLQLLAVISQHNCPSSVSAFQKHLHKVFHKPVLIIRYKREMRSHSLSHFCYILRQKDKCPLNIFYFLSHFCYIWLVRARILIDFSCNKLLIFSKKLERCSGKTWNSVTWVWNRSWKIVDCSGLKCGTLLWFYFNLNAAKERQNSVCRQVNVWN